MSVETKKYPWDDEPDHEAFEHAGLPCMLHRGPVGSWCGYAAVPPGHPAHGEHYDHIDVEVHGGLTYARECQGPICHVPTPGEPDDVWWIGFDCSHVGDVIPAMEKWFGWREFYKDIAFVRAETQRLAEQLAAMA